MGSTTLDIGTESSVFRKLLELKAPDYYSVWYSVLSVLYSRHFSVLSSTNGSTVFKTSSARRILERGGAGNSENLRRTKIRMEIFSPKISPVFLSKIRWRPKKRSSIHSNLVQFLAQNWVQAKNKGLHCAQSFCPSSKGGWGMPQFCILFYANYTILVT